MHGVLRGCPRRAFGTGRVLHRRRLARGHRSSEMSMRLDDCPGVGPALATAPSCYRCRPKGLSIRAPFLGLDRARAEAALEWGQGQAARAVGKEAAVRPRALLEHVATTHPLKHIRLDLTRSTEPARRSARASSPHRSPRTATSVRICHHWNDRWHANPAPRYFLAVPDPDWRCQLGPKPSAA